MKFKWLVASLALVATTPAAAEWQKASSQHFIVYSDDKPQTVAAYASKLERFDRALRVLNGTPETAISSMARVMVFVVPDVEEVQRLMGNGNDTVAGFYLPRAQQTVAFVPRQNNDSLSALVILLHEYTHHFMFSTYGNTAFPSWLVEGFAEFYATAIFHDDGIVLGATPTFREYGMTDVSRMPASKLLSVSPNDLRDRDERSIFYSRAWLMTHYLMTDAANRQRLIAYLNAINSGTPPVEATRRLGDPHKLDYQLDAHLRRQRLPAFTVLGDQLKIEAVTVRALSAGEAATMPARIASSRGVDKSTAPAVAALARRLAAPYPNDAGAQEALAEAEYDAGNFAAARTAADRALAADPKSIHATIYEGMAREAEAVKAKATDAATWAEVRRWYLKANRLDPEYASPLDLFYSTYPLAKQPASANAQAGLLYAHALAPFDLALGLRAAHVLLEQNKPNDARTVLKPIAFNPHAGPVATRAGAVIAEIDKNGAAAALALMDKPASAPIDAASAKKPRP